MNEFRVPDNNVQNGILKALSFIFEYLSTDGYYYLQSISSLIATALANRDIVHRQIAATAMKHAVLGVEGRTDIRMLLHFTNYVWPNIYEQSPHSFFATREAIHGLHVSVGIGHTLNYVFLGLFHPARRIRESHWDIYNGSLKYFEDKSCAYCTSLLRDKQISPRLFI